MTTFDSTFGKADVSEVSQGKWTLGSEGCSSAEDVHSYPSTPLTMINIPDPGTVNVEFVYNFYTFDERVNGSGTSIEYDPLNPAVTAELEDILMRTPRYVLFEVAPSTFTGEDPPDPLLDQIAPLAKAALVTGNTVPKPWGIPGEKFSLSLEDDLQYEDAISNAYFSSVKMIDTGIDEEFYLILSASSTVLGIDMNVESGVAASSDISDAISTQNMLAGSIVREAMGNYQAQGVAYASTDTREEVASDSLRHVKLLEFDFNVNNLIFNDLMKASCEDQVHVYEDELRYVLNRSNPVQKVARASALPGTIDSNEYDWCLKAIWEKVLTEEQVNDYGFFNEATLPIGYLVEKTEITMDGSEMKYPDTFVPSYDTINFIDSGVRYGGLYVLRVRTVALCRFEVICRDPWDSVNDEVVSVVCLVASGGRLFSVYCVENIPPPCPPDITFIYDYELDNLCIFWQPPIHRQKDHVRYQVFRRRSINEPFTIIGELDFDDSVIRVIPLETVPSSKKIRVHSPQTFWRDTSFTKESDYIYAVACIDARGLTSSYSPQKRVTFDIFKNQLVINHISACGAPKPYPNMFLNEKAFPDTMKDSGHSRMRLYYNPEFYKVLKDVTAEPSKGNPIPPVKYQDLQVLGNCYYLHIINVDLQQDWLIKIKILDDTGPPIAIRASTAIVRTLGLNQVELAFESAHAHIGVDSGDPDFSYES